MNSENEDTPEVIPTDEFVKVCEELGLLEPNGNEITEDMWKRVDFDDYGW